MSRLLLLGVSGKPDWALQSYWDLGGPGIFTSEHPFDFEYLPLPSSKYIAKYDLLGSVRAETSHPFDLGTVVAWYLENPFDFIANAPQPAIGITPTPPPLLPGQTPGPPPAFIPGIGIYSKAGIYIGSITKWSSVDARSIAIRDSGSSRFTVPIKTGLLGADNTELDLIQLDRIVVIGNNLGTPTWAGTISALEWGNGIVNVSCEDLFALGAGVEVGYSGGSVDPAAAPDPADSYAATEYAKQILLLNGEVAHIAVAKVISQINAFRSRDGEVLWELDATGSNTFFGDENISGDGLSTLATIADRSFSEYSWAVRVETTRMVPILVWRDAFTAPAGAALHDGVDANMDVNIMYRETSQPIINAIRITGSVTKIQNLIPEGAVVIPVAELIPVAEIWLNPGTYRRRVNFGESAGIKLNVTVPFSFPEETQKALADAEAAKLMLMFEKYLAAIHDQLGQPYFSEGFNPVGGWAWAGPTENIPEYTEEFPNGYPTFGERHLHVGDWIHHRFLAPGPQSIVMEKKTGGSRVRISYDRPTATQLVARNSLTTVENPETVYAFERRYIKNWDPRSDGVGKKINVTTVIRGAVVTGERWRIVSWNQLDQNISSSIVGGLTVGATLVQVSGLLAFPAPPFEAVIGGDETVMVTGLAAGWYTVTRGIGGTTAIEHDPGESFEYITTMEKEPDPEDPGQPPAQRVPWPEGEAYAYRLLAKLSRPQRVLSLNVVNRAGEWSTIALGSTHSVTISTEGPPGGIVVTGRVVAYAPDELAGTMEVVMEVDLP